jgi:hypothetical protein
LDLQELVVQMRSHEELVAAVLEQQVWELVQLLVQREEVLVQLFVSPLEPEEHLCLVVQLLLVHQAYYF